MLPKSTNSWLTLMGISFGRKAKSARNGLQGFGAAVSCSAIAAGGADRIQWPVSRWLLPLLRRRTLPERQLWSRRGTAPDPERSFAFLESRRSMLTQGRVALGLSCLASFLNCLRSTSSLSALFSIGPDEVQMLRNGFSLGTDMKKTR